MKSMSDESNNNKNNNWLGFSLSPHINTTTMESSLSPSETSHEHSSNHTVSSSTALPTSYFNLPSHFNYYPNLYCGVEGENGGGVYSAFPVMPLKSDGSLCIMEAITRSQTQGMVTSTPPKLENFFGGVTMGTSDNTMALSLDSMYYQHQNPDHRQQQQIQPQQQYPDYSAFRGLYQTVQQEEPKENTQIADCTLHLPAIGEDDIGGMKNWISRNYQHGGECGPVGGIGYGDLQSLSLSMSPVSQSSSCVTGPNQIMPTVAQTECVVMDTKKRGSEKVEQKQIVHRKSLDTFGQRTSQYRGVTRHRWTGRYEAHLCGITVAKKKARAGREDKFIWGVMIWKRKLLELMI